MHFVSTSWPYHLDNQFLYFDFNNKTLMDSLVNYSSNPVPYPKFVIAMLKIVIAAFLLGATCDFPPFYMLSIIFNRK